MEKDRNRVDALDASRGEAEIELRQEFLFDILNADPLAAGKGFARKTLERVVGAETPEGLSIDSVFGEAVELLGFFVEKVKNAYMGAGDGDKIGKRFASEGFDVNGVEFGEEIAETGLAGVGQAEFLVLLGHFFLGKSEILVRRLEFADGSGDSLRHRVERFPDEGDGIVAADVGAGGVIAVAEFVGGAGEIGEAAVEAADFEETEKESDDEEDAEKQRLNPVVGIGHERKPEHDDQETDDYDERDRESPEAEFRCVGGWGHADFIPVKRW